MCNGGALHPSDEQSSNRCLLFRRDPPSQRALSASLTSSIVGEKKCAEVRQGLHAGLFLEWPDDPVFLNLGKPKYPRQLLSSSQSDTVVKPNRNSLRGGGGGGII